MLSKPRCYSEAATMADQVKDQKWETPGDVDQAMYHDPWIFCTLWCVRAPIKVDGQQNTHELATATARRRRTPPGTNTDANLLL